MIVPCIDLMEGQAVQLVQGRKKALEIPVDEALTRFGGFPKIHVIDLDAAMGRPPNRQALGQIFAGTAAEVRVGGGVRTVEVAQHLITQGASQVIIGSAAYLGDAINADFLESLAAAIGSESVIIAIDVAQGRVAVNGWRTLLNLTPSEAIQQVGDRCAGFLCTSVDHEGLLGGTDLGLFGRLRALTDKTLIAAGGISTMDEAKALTSQGIEVALGMALYTGAIDPGEVTEA